MKKLSFLFLFVLTLVSCSMEKQPIAYGEDSCDFCKMTIVDQIHGAELLTDKGKVYKFDALECMLNFEAEMGKEKAGQFYTNHFLSPGELIRAEEASFLITENIPSPMGEFITAFPSQKEAEKVQAEKDGEVYTWGALKKQQNQ
ncbi:nitrous oxide reductase accessory protein NosL [Mesonia sp. MT50]|uniref:Nitrous oxide reductase accessory protein NosL n=1 Tax=Mesonia profundi TaxID=3070998 RepID=A0ABU1A3R0_9FLAO|nr:nitrous oxide reductase accessory protein NosL [Mesonia profundi]MDQ7918348.1 nitrous oxide reductase accessory protein NosL [Mesonia profundi]